MMTDQAKSRGIVRFREAAEVLQRLGLCKAFGPRGQVNGPNCQRFGHRESISRRWYWDVNEILEKAVRKVP